MRACASTLSLPFCASHRRKPADTRRRGPGRSSRERLVLVCVFALHDPGFPVERSSIPSSVDRRRSSVVPGALREAVNGVFGEANVAEAGTFEEVSE
jgi:hypothetical protein